MPGAVTLREVLPEDLPSFYTYQADPEAHRLAAVQPRDRQALYAHWQHIMGDDTSTAPVAPHGQGSSFSPAPVSR